LRFLDAHRIDGANMRPVGAAMPAYEFDETLVLGMDPVWNNVAVDGDKIVLELGGINTNIWNQVIDALIASYQASVGLCGASSSLHRFARLAKSVSTNNYTRLAQLPSGIGMAKCLIVLLGSSCHLLAHNHKVWGKGCRTTVTEPVGPNPHFPAVGRHIFATHSVACKRKMGVQRLDRAFKDSNAKACRMRSGAQNALVTW
jgi:hypothetical protein